MRLYLDDEREAPTGWVRCYWPGEVIYYLNSEHPIEAISLDHDLGNDKKGTGYDVLAWIEEQQVLYGFIPPRKILIHTANPAARKRMEAALRSIKRRDPNDINLCLLTNPSKTI